MRLSPKALGITIGVLWGAAMLLIGLGHLSTSYGAEFLAVMSSVYPGYKASGTLGDVLVGAAYALVDGAIGGFVLAWFYNLVLARLEKAG